MQLEAVIERIRPLDAEAMQRARRRQDRLTKPPGSLGRLEELAIQLAGVLASDRPSFGGKAIVVAAADHGVVAEGVSGYPQAVTAQMVQNFLSGGAAINVLAQQAGASLIVVDAGLAIELASQPELRSVRIGAGTANFTRGPAMTWSQADQSIAAGIHIANDVVDAGADLIGVGDMGIGNSTAAAAITSVLCRAAPSQSTGRGAGRSDAELAAKIEVVERAIEANQPDRSDGRNVLARIGGFEIGVLAGVMLGVAARRRVVVLDGFISTSAALIAQALAPVATEYFVASHLSAERGHQVSLAQLGLRPLLDLGLRLGEGSGAALAMPLIEASAACLREMATFEEAGVSDSDAGLDHEHAP